MINFQLGFFCSDFAKILLKQIIHATAYVLIILELKVWVEVIDWNSSGKSFLIDRNNKTIK